MERVVLNISKALNADGRGDIPPGWCISVLLGIGSAGPGYMLKWGEMELEIFFRGDFTAKSGVSETACVEAPPRRPIWISYPPPIGNIMPEPLFHVA
jgi:hypothetical protein